jgi:hypothetical protein
MQNLGQTFIGFSCLLCLLMGCELLKDKVNTSSNSSSSTETTSYKLPFPVTVEGQSAVENMLVCASIANPVSTSASIELGVTLEAGEQAIVNAFQADAQGNPLPEHQNKATIVLLQGNKGSLGQNMANSPALQSGATYVMNIVAKGNTARVYFKVK